MGLDRLLELCQTGGGILAPFLLLALLWMNGERKDARAEAKEATAKLADLSERTLVLFTEIKGLVGKHK